MRIERKRSAVRSLTWGVFSSCVILGLSQTLDLEASLWSLVCIDTGTRVLAYYLHDRAWALSRFGIKPARVYLCPTARDQFTSKHL